jgi:hypothetical protein
VHIINLVNILTTMVNEKMLQSKNFLKDTNSGEMEPKNSTLTQKVIQWFFYNPFHFHGAWPSSSFSYDSFMPVYMVYNRAYWNMLTFEWQYISCKSFSILEPQESNGLTIWQSLLLTLRMLVVFFHKLFGFMVTFFEQFFI